jgi:hypothetical protein
MDRTDLPDGRSFLIAVPEKALADKMHCDRGAGIRTQRDLSRYLFDNLRIDQAALTALDLELIAQIASNYRSLRIRLLGRLIRRLRGQHRGHADA